MNPVVSLVVLLVVASILLVLVSRSGEKCTEVDEEKIETSWGVTPDIPQVAIHFP